MKMRRYFSKMGERDTQITRKTTTNTTDYCNEYIAITREQANLKHLQRIFILQWWDSNQKGKFIWSKNHRQDPWQHCSGSGNHTIWCKTRINMENQ